MIKSRLVKKAKPKRNMLTGQERLSTPSLKRFLTNMVQSTEREKKSWARAVAIQGYSKRVPAEETEQRLLLSSSFSYCFYKGFWINGLSSWDVFPIA